MNLLSQLCEELDKRQMLELQSRVLDELDDLDVDFDVSLNSLSSLIVSSPNSKPIKIDLTQPTWSKLSFENVAKRIAMKAVGAFMIGKLKHSLEKHNFEYHSTQYTGSSSLGSPSPYIAYRGFRLRPYGDRITARIMLDVCQVELSTYLRIRAGKYQGTYYLSAVTSFEPEKFEAGVEWIKAHLHVQEPPPVKQFL